MAIQLIQIGSTEYTQENGYYSIENDFTEVSLDAVRRQRINGPGESIVSRSRPNNVYTLSFHFKAASETALYGMVKSALTDLSPLTAGSSVSLRYRPSADATLVTTDIVHADRKTTFTRHTIDDFICSVVLTLECTPYWYGDTIEIARQTILETPGLIPLGTIEGELETDLFIELYGSGVGNFGSDIIVGARALPVPEAGCNLVKDFTGTTEAGWYGGNYMRKANVSNAAWVSLTSDITADLYGVAAGGSDSGVIVAVGAGGVAYKSEDGGDVWETLTTGTTQNLYGVAIWKDGSTYHLWIVGAAGTLLYSTGTAATVGDTISADASGTTNDLRAVSAGTKDAVWAVGFNSTIIKTENGTAGVGSTTWSAQTPASGAVTTAGFYGVKATDASTAYACGIGTNNQPRLEYTNVSNPWTNITLPSTGQSMGRLYDVGVVDANTILTVGEYSLGGLAFRSVAGVWASSGLTGVGTAWKTVEIIDSTHGWVGGNGGLIMQMTAWDSYAAQDPVATSTINAIAIDNTAAGSEDLVAVGGGATQRFTTNGGTTWTTATGSFGFALPNDGSLDGRYQAWAHVRSADADPNLAQIRASAGFAGGTFRANSAVYLADSATFQWVNCGPVAFPAVPVSSHLDPRPSPALLLEAVGSSGSGANFDIGCAVLVPIDGGACRVTAQATPAKALTMDSANGAVNLGNSIVDYIGLPVRAQPGDNNVLVMETGGVRAVDVRIRYRPQYASPIAGA